MSSGRTLGGFTFNAGAPAYSFASSTTSTFLSFTGAGIVNNSSNAPTFNLTASNPNTGFMLFNNSASAGNAAITVNTLTELRFNDSSSAGTASITNTGTGMTVFAGTSSAGNATIVNNGTTESGTHFGESSSAGNATIITNSGASTQFQTNSSGGTARLITNSGAYVSFLAPNMSVGSIEGAGRYLISTNSLTVGTNNLSTTVSGSIESFNSIDGPPGPLIKVGTGTLTLSGTNTYSGGTVVSAGTLRIGTGGSLLPTGALTVNGGTFDLNGAIQTVGSLSGTGGVLALGTGTLTVNQSSNTSYAGVISGPGSLVKGGAGTLELTGNNTFSGGSTVSGGRLAVNGSLVSGVTIGSGGELGGSGTVTGAVVNSGAISPGNSIGTLNIVGSYTHNSGAAYKVEINAAGQSDKIAVSGSPGTASLMGGTVNVLAQPGAYGPTTTYTILTTTGGLSGTFSGVTSSSAFLVPTLSYDGNNVYLLIVDGFADGARTPNQRVVGGALDRGSASATGDFAAVLTALANLSASQGPAALEAISGQPYSGFATASVQSGLLFMDAVGSQMGALHGSKGGGQRVALAEACDEAISSTCQGQTASRWGAWFNGIAGTGTVPGDSNAGALTYSQGGLAAGTDYRINSSTLAGVSVGYLNGRQWVNGFNGLANNNSYTLAAYGSYAPQPVYVDVLAGFSYGDNSMTRTIAIPGLAPRTALGRAGSSQLLGQIEAGYQVMVSERAAGSITPFARLQGSTTTQSGFTESGADSLNLIVAPQTTNSLRTTLGSDFAAALDLGWREPLALKLRLGWAHEYADTLRPTTAAFAGAPAFSYTVFGATAARDSAVVGLAADTAVAAATSLYARYDGQIGGGSENHIFSAGLRMTW